MKVFSVKNYAGLCCIFTIGKKIRRASRCYFKTLEIMTLFNVPLNLSFFWVKNFFLFAAHYIMQIYLECVNVCLINLLALAGHCVQLCSF